MEQVFDNNFVHWADRPDVAFRCPLVEVGELDRGGLFAIPVLDAS